MSLTKPTHDETARLDLVEGVRRFNYRRVVGPLLESYPTRIAERRDRGGQAPATKEDARLLFRDDPAYLLSCGLQRSMQQIAWSTAVDSVRASPPPPEPGPDRDQAPDPTAAVLELDPELELPDWYTTAARAGTDDIHLVPGGYWGDPRVGEIYDRGGAVYRLAWRKGYDGRPGALEAFVASVAPAECRRAVDLGCSFGATTRALHRMLPRAEVTGIDLSAAALTYAHRVTRDGAGVTYAQRDATSTGMAADSVDLVVGFLLLHEVPDDVRAEIMSESLRILRPGGRLAFLDIPPYSALEPAHAFFESFDGRGNGEEHWEAFLSSDFPHLLRETGFDDVHDGPLDYEEPDYWGSSALWRTGRFDLVHRWVTVATKPSAASAGS